MKHSRRGRPAFSPTPAMRRKVAAAAGGGMPHEEIAIALGISRMTLVKYFDHELSVGAYRKRLEVIEAMQIAAKKGSVAAAKAYIAMTPEVEAPPASPEHGLPPADKVAPLPLGKKEQAQAEAATAHLGTDWDHLLHPGSSTPQ